MSQGVYVLGSKCPGGKCPGGKCPGGICPWGKCPGGICPWGKCPGGTCPGGLGPRTILNRMGCLDITSDNKVATVCVLFYQAFIFYLYTSSTGKQM